MATVESTNPIHPPLAGQGTVPPEGKGATDESFPVASLLIPAALRQSVLEYYRFARLADDVADSPALTSRQKIDILDAADGVLRGGEARGGEHPPLYAAAARLHDTLSRANVPIEHAAHLLQAFRQDATRTRYETWSDLLLYCTYSAAPVGRFLLDLHGEQRAAWRFADPLCQAHQILNHVQDCRADFLSLDRVYMPGAWFDGEGASIGMLADTRSAPALRRVLDRALAETAGLLRASAPLPRAIRSRGLRIQAATTVAMGWRLLERLRRHDPLAGHVAVGPVSKLYCVTRGLIGGWRDRGAVGG